MRERITTDPFHVCDASGLPPGPCRGGSSTASRRSRAAARSRLRNDAALQENCAPASQQSTHTGVRGREGRGGARCGGASAQVRKRRITSLAERGEPREPVVHRRLPQVIQSALRRSTAAREAQRRRFRAVRSETGCSRCGASRAAVKAACACADLWSRDGRGRRCHPDLIAATGVAFRLHSRGGNAARRLSTHYRRLGEPGRALRGLISDPSQCCCRPRFHVGGTVWRPAMPVGARAAAHREVRHILEPAELVAVDAVLRHPLIGLCVRF